MFECRAMVGLDCWLPAAAAPNLLICPLPKDYNLGFLARYAQWLALFPNSAFVACMGPFFYSFKFCWMPPPPPPPPTIWILGVSETTTRKPSYVTSGQRDGSSQAGWRTAGWSW